MADHTLFEITPSINRRCAVCGDPLQEGHKVVCGQPCSWKYKRLPSIRFWAKVDKGGPIPRHMPHLGNCWLWTGAKTKSNKGVYVRGNFYDGRKYVRAHQFSYRLAKGDTHGLHVCHHCDNPICVRPDHLYAGTRTQNMHDCAKRHRAKNTPKHGEENGNAKLTNEIVMAIREEFLGGGITFMAIGKKYGIRDCTAAGIIRREAWKHIP